MTKSPIPTWSFALVVVRDGDRVLLVQERKHGQSWYLPAGRVELGESFAEAAKRETLEEAGIGIVLEGIVRIEYHARPRDARMRVVYVARPAACDPPKSVPDEDSLGAAWFRLGDMELLDLRATEARTFALHVLSGGAVQPLSLLAGDGFSG